MATVQKFDAPNRAGGRQFVAHGVYIGATKYSIWFSDHEGGTLVDAERFDKRGTPYGIRRSQPAWGTLNMMVPRLIAQYEREAAAYLAERTIPETED